MKGTEFALQARPFWSVVRQGARAPSSLWQTHDLHSFPFCRGGVGVRSRAAIEVVNAVEDDPVSRLPVAVDGVLEAVSRVDEVEASAREDQVIAQAAAEGVV